MGINVVGKPSIIESKVYHAVARQGSSIADIVGNASDDVIVQLEGQFIPRDKWRKITPKNKTTITISRVPRGESIGKVLAVIAVIAVAVYAPYSLGMIGSGGAVTAAGSIVSAGIMVVGNALISAAFSPDLDSGSFSSEGTSGGAGYSSLTSIRNVPVKYGVVPKLFGKNWSTPPLAAMPYSEVRGGRDQYIYTLLALGYGNQRLLGHDFLYGDPVVKIYKSNGNLYGSAGYDLSKIKIGETAITEFDDWELQISHGSDISSYTNDVNESGVNVLFSKNSEPESIIRTTAVDADSASIDLVFGQGLYSMNYAGRKAGGAVRLGFEIPLSISPTGRIPEYSLSGIVNGDFRLYGVSKVYLIPSNLSTGNHQSKVSVNYITDVFDYGGGGWSTVPATDNYIINYTVSNGKPSITSVTKNGTNVAGYINRMVIAGDRVVIKIQYAPTGTNAWVSEDLNWTDGEYAGERAISGGNKDAFAKSYDIKFPERGQYDIKVTRLRSVNGYSNYVYSDFSWVIIRSVKSSSPSSIDNLLKVALKVKATDQLNGTLDNVSLYSESILPDFNENGMTGVYSVSNNPARAYIEALTGVHNVVPVKESDIDWYEMNYWKNWCDSNSITYNHIHQRDETQFQRLSMIAATGLAKFNMIDGMFTIVTDKTQPVSHVINPRNTLSFSSTKMFIDIPDAFRVEYRDESTNQTDEVTVYNDGFTAQNATKFEVLPTVGVTDPEQAWKYGRYHLSQAILRPEVYTVELDIESIRYAKGDTVKLAYDVMLVGLSWGRVVSFTNTTIIVDEEVVIEESKSYSMLIRKVDGTTIEFPVSGVANKAQTTLQWSMVEGVEIGDLMSFGESTRVTTEARVANISKGKSDMSATVDLVDAANNIYDGWVGQIPEFSANTSIPPELRNPPAVNVTNVESDVDNLVRNIDGSYSTSIDISWTVPPTLTPIMHLEIRYSEHISDDELGQQKKIIVEDYQAGTYRLTGVESGSIYSIKVVAVSIARNISEGNQVTEIKAFSSGDYVEVSITPEITMIESGTEHLVIQSDGTVISRMYVEWNPPAVNVEVVNYVMQYRPKDSLVWMSLIIPPNETSSYLDRVNDGTVYDVSLKSLYRGEIESEAFITSHAVIGKTELPSNVQSGSVIVEDRLISINWDAVSDLDVRKYEIRKGDSWNDSVYVNTVESTSWSRPADITGEHIWLIKAVDTSGGKSLVAKSLSIVITPPEIPVVDTQVIGSKVLFKHESLSGSLPIDYYLIERDNLTIGDAKGTFSMIEEAEGGDYIYSVTAIDIAGNKSEKKYINVFVSDPQDYVLNAKFSSLLDGTLFNAIAENGLLIMPVNATETVSQFDARNAAFQTTQDYIDSGFENVLTPTDMQTSYYEESYDYGALLPSTLITLTTTSLREVGNCLVSATIETSSDGITFDAFNGWQVYATEFRYVRFRITVSTDTQDDQIIYSNIQLKLDSKLNNDSVSGRSLAADQNGTFFSFNVSFVDVTSIVVSPRFSSTVDPDVKVVSRWDDTPYPTGFYVFAFDSNGVRIDHDFSASIRGY